ncbi:hypothetical protein JHK82_028398 [Glycine max]|nr:hypothetical protein JHK82_028398 [Glycine max]
MASLSCSANDLAPLFNDTAAANYLCAQFDSISRKLNVTTYAVDNTYLLFQRILSSPCSSASPCSAPAPSEPKHHEHHAHQRPDDAAAGGLSYYLFGFAFAFGGPSTTASSAATSSAYENSRRTPLPPATTASSSTTGPSPSPPQESPAAPSPREHSSWLTFLLFFLNRFRLPHRFALVLVLRRLGQRESIGRFDRSGRSVALRGHSASLVVLGTFLLWFGWYGFNLCSFLTIAKGYESGGYYGQWSAIGRTAVTTTLAGSTAALTTLFSKRLLAGHWNVIDVCNGLLGGFAAITSGCAVVGTVGRDCVWVEYDDPLEARGSFTAGAERGVSFTGLFAKKEYVEEIYDGGRPFGALMGGGGRLLAAQVIQILVVCGWVTATMAPLFYGLHKMKLLRISRE